MRWIFLIFFFILSSTHSGAGTRNPNIDDQEYVKYGQNFECVGRIVGSYNDNKDFLASGVAIDSHHVLTAAHVVKNNFNCYFITQKKKICLSKVIYHKEFVEEIYGKYDIAICYSEEDIGLTKYPKLYEYTDELTKKCDISGFGFYGTFETGAKFSDYKRRAGTNIIDHIYDDLLVCTPSKQESEDLTKLEFIIAIGDSGGGLFINGELAGINSCLMSDTKTTNSSSYDDESGHTRISKYIDWINSNKSK